VLALGVSWLIFRACVRLDQLLRWALAAVWCSQLVKSDQLPRWALSRVECPQSVKSFQLLKGLASATVGSRPAVAKARARASPGAFRILPLIGLPLPFRP
jgi:hypothetical protein